MSLTTTDKQDIKVMIREGIENSPIINIIQANVNKLEVLNEDVRHRVNAILEIVSVFADSSKKIENHEVRLEEIEIKQPLIIDTLKLHSKQLGNRL